MIRGTIYKMSYDFLRIILSLSIVNYGVHGPCSRPVSTGVQKFVARSVRELLFHTFKIVVNP